jgi:hypothetical protein
MQPDRPFYYVNYLGRGDAPRLFRGLQEIISHIEGLMDGDGLLIGVKGDWGTGKTSILRALESYFKDNKGFPTIFFEAWKYQDEKDPLIPLLIKMEEVATSETAKKLRKIAKIFLAPSLILSDLLLRHLTKLGFGKKVGIKEIKETLSLLDSLFLERYSIFEKSYKELKDLVNEIVGHYRAKADKNLKEKWETFLEGTFRNKEHKYLVIFVDDLDRLLPDKALRLLEMIRFYLDIPKTLVIMGINDKVLIEHIIKHYNLKEGEEFLEKIFQWSYELGSIPFSKDYMGKIHFENLQKKVTLDDNLFDLFNAIDPLTHRKWVKIANRMEMKAIEKGDLHIRDAWFSILEECLPTVERFIRKFPNLEAALSKDINGLKNEYPHIHEEIEKMVEEDKTFFQFPKVNFQRLCEFQGRFVEEKI